MSLNLSKTFGLIRPMTRSLLLGTSTLTRFAVNGVEAALALDFIGGEYRLADTASSFDAAFVGSSPKLTYGTTSNSTMVDSSGNIVWAPHNLVEDSEDPSQGTTTDDATLSGSTLTATAQSGNQFPELNRISTVSTGTTTWWADIENLTNVQYVSMATQLFNTDANGTSIFELGSTPNVANEGANHTATVVEVTSGVYRCSITFTTDGTDNVGRLALGMSDLSGQQRVADPDGTESMDIVRQQINRSDLGGMAPVPGAATGFETYVPTNGSAEYLPRVGHHVYNGSAWVNEGLLIESEARTNLLTSSADFTDATWLETFSDVPMDAVGPDGASNSAGTLTGNGGGTGTAYTRVNVTVSTETTYTFSVFAKADQLSEIQLRCVNFTTPANGGVYFDLSAGAVGNSAGSGITAADAQIEDFGSGWYRCSITFTTDVADTSGDIQIYLANGGSSQVSRDGTSSVLLYGAQLEVGSTPSSYMPSNATTQGFRDAQTLTVPPAEFGWNSDAVSIQMDGRMTYADEDQTTEMELLRWYADASNSIRLALYTGGNLPASTGDLDFVHRAAAVTKRVFSSGDTYSPGVNVPFNISSRHGSTFVNGAVDGVALTENTNPTALPDLASTNLQIAQDFMGTIGTFRQFAGDIGDTGLATATNPSTEPTLSLSFDGTGGSFYNLSWSE